MQSLPKRYPPVDFLKARRRHPFFGRCIVASRGFSLIEVVIAMGIFVFAVVPVIGLVSSGMKNMRQSMDDSIKADILKNVVAQIQATPYTNITASNYYFTDQGVLLDSSNSSCLFVASTTISDPPALVATSTNIARLLNITVRHCLDTNNKTVFSQLLLNNPQ